MEREVSIIWEIALTAMKKDNLSIFGPLSFKEYLRSNQLPHRQTAQSISIDSYEKLHQSLKKEHTMVLRLGGEKETRFILVRVNDSLHDFFLHDHEVFSEQDAKGFKPVVPESSLMGYKIMPILSETSLVNLALTSGILGQALNFDKVQVPGAPATGKSTFSFEFKPHSSIDQVFEHYKGQVEIDALFVEKRNGEDTLFVIEAKNDIKQRSLAKHKLAYPVLAVTRNLPKNVHVVPVYLRTYKDENYFYFNVLECEIPDPRANIVAIDEIKPKKHSYFKLKL